MLEWTGERYLPWLEDAGTQIHYEHLHRYSFASRFAIGKRVLDLGCGEGYGAFSLGEHAMSVVGVDIDHEAIAHARNAYYLRPNVTFVQADITNVPVDGPFDVITCFEALEHVSDHSALLNEVRRLLASGGVFIVSTPNRAAYSDASGYRNPYHVRELYYDEFRTAIGNSFEHVGIFGQRNHVGSFIWSLGKRASLAACETFVEKAPRGFQTAPGGFKRPLYFLAVASNHALSDDVWRSDTLLDISRGYVEELSEISSGHSVSVTEPSLRNIDQLLKDKQRLDAERLQIEAQRQEIEAQRQEIEAQRQEIEAQRQETEAQRQKLERSAQDMSQREAGLSEERRRAEQELADKQLSLEVRQSEHHTAVERLKKELMEMEKERLRLAQLETTLNQDLLSLKSAASSRQQEAAEELEMERDNLRRQLLALASHYEDSERAHSACRDRQERSLREIEVYKGTIRGQREALDLVYSSLGWKLVKAYRRICDRVLGAETSRRRAYLRLLRRVKGSHGTDVLNPSAQDPEQPPEVEAATAQTQQFYWNLARYLQTEPCSLTAMVDIVICYAGNEELLERCVRSIVDHTPEPYAIHLVVHATHADRIPASVKDRVLVSVHSMPVFNFAVANNMVLAASENDVVLLNDDTEVTHAWLRQLREDSRGFALTGAHTGYQCAGNPDMWGEGAARLTWYPINMFCTYIPWRVRRVVGPLDEEYFYYGGEDVDYSCRALKHGIPLVVSSAYVHHAGSQSFGERKTRLMVEADKITKEKHGVEPPFDLSAMLPLVSVIIATHNRAEFLPRAARSILDGDYRNIELVVVDDNSDDDTWKVINGLQRHDMRVVGMRLAHGRGCVGARQAGFQASRGPFVAYMDDDDVARPNRIMAPLTMFLQRPNLDVVYCDWEVVTEQGRTRGRSAPFNVDDYLAMKFDIGSGALLARRRTIEEVPFMSTYDRAIDFDWVFRLVRRGFSIDYCPAVVLDYNRTGPAESHLSGNGDAARVHWEIQEREHLIRGSDA